MKIKSKIAVLIGWTLHFVLKAVAAGNKGRKIVFCEIFYLRLGHLACDTGLFLKKLEEGKDYSRKNIYIGIAPGIEKSANKQIMKMFKRRFPIITNTFLFMLLKTLKKVGSEFYMLMPHHSANFSEFNDFQPVLSFEKEEEDRGRDMLKKMGIGPDAWFVCFMARDGSYLNEQKEFRGSNWDYHNYRNSDINSFLKAAEYIAQEGGFVVRMGSIVQNDLPKERHSRIIDYSSEYRSDFMDIYLMSHCKFFFADSCGIVNACTIFGVPVAYTNVAIYEFGGFLKEDLFILKKMYSTVEKRYLTYEEVFNSEISRFYTTEDFKKRGLSLEENTSDEILDLVMEMNGRLNGISSTTEEDDALQRGFHALYLPEHRSYGTKARVGAKFLRQTKGLLGGQSICGLNEKK